MTTNRRADSVVFGFDFQVNAAIIIMLENIKDMVSLRLEGNHEDIEVKLNDDSYIFAQAKAVVRANSDFTNVRANLKKAIKTLSEASSSANVRELIFITNTIDPLKENVSKYIFSDMPARRKYDDLPDESKVILDSMFAEMSIPFEKNKFKIQNFRYETDDDRERLKQVLREIERFLGGLDISSISVVSFVDKLHRVWHLDIFENASKKDADIVLNKKDIIWPLIVIITETVNTDGLADYFEGELYDDVIYHYHKIIEECCERFEFCMKVLYDYNDFKCNCLSSEKYIKFAFEKWRNYIEDFNAPEIALEVKEALIKIILYKIVSKRRAIEKIKKGVNL